MSEQPPPAARFGFASESMQVDALFDALAQAQAKIGHAVKNAENPHFGKDYADLSAVVDASRPFLAEHGLSIVQRPDIIPGVGPVMRTRLGHKSGQWIESVTLILGDKNPQTYVAGGTYARRLGWASIVGVAPEGEDDDGETAEGRGKAKGKASEPAARPQPPERAPAGERREAPRQAQRAPATAPASGQASGQAPEEFVSPMGRSKGQRLGDIDDEGLEWLAKVFAERADDPQKARYREENMANCAKVRTVLGRREEQRTAQRTGIRGPLDGRNVPARGPGALDVGDDPAGLAGGYDGYDDRGDDPDAY